MSEFVTKAEYTRRRGWSNRSTATRFAQSGKIVLTDDGRVDVAASDALLDALADPTKAGVAERHARDRANKAIDTALRHDVAPKKPPAALPEPPATSPDRAAFLSAQADKERELANLARIKREEQEGSLVRTDDVKRAVENLATIVSKGLTGIPARVMPLINGEPDAAKREQLLEREIRAVLTEFADAALAMSAPPQ